MTTPQHDDFYDYDVDDFPDAEGVKRPDSLNVESNVVSLPTAGRAGFSFGPKPEITTSWKSDATLAGEAWAHILRHKDIGGRLFRQGDRLMMTHETQDGLLKLRDMTREEMYGVLVRTIKWIKLRKAQPGEETRDQWVPMEIPGPSQTVVKDMLAFPHRQVGEVESIYYGPVVTKTGILSTHGYHREWKVYIHRPNPKPLPTMTVTESVAFLRDWLCDFPFASQADFAHAIALFLLPFVRLLIDGPTPFHLVDAPMEGTGKSKLCRVLASGGVGRMVAERPWPLEEAERRKTMTTIITSGDPVGIFDNITDYVSSPAFCTAIAGRRWADRILGTQRDVETSNIRTIWAGSSNNASMSPDMTRRTIPIRLVRKKRNWRPETDARHFDIEHYTEKNLDTLQACAMTLIQSWLDKKMPPPSSSSASIGSFENWWYVIGGILNHAGVEDFAANRATWERQADLNQSEWSEFFGRVIAQHGEPATGETPPLTVDEMMNVMDQEPPLFAVATGHRVSPESQRRGVIRKLLLTQRDRLVGDTREHQFLTNGTTFQLVRSD